MREVSSSIHVLCVHNRAKLRRPLSSNHNMTQSPPTAGALHTANCSAHSLANADIDPVPHVPKVSVLAESGAQCSSAHHAQSLHRPLLPCYFSITSIHLRDFTLITMDQVPSRGTRVHPRRSQSTKAPHCQQRRRVRGHSIGRVCRSFSFALRPTTQVRPTCGESSRISG